MPRLIKHPTHIPAAGSPPKKIRELIGRLSSGTTGVSIAWMESPAGWSEPSQRPEFTEYTVVLAGTLRMETDDEVLEAQAGQALVAEAGARVRYSTPNPEGASYIAICMPAFSADTVHREEAGA